MALDAKMNFDDNALFASEIVALRDLDEESCRDRSLQVDLSYISSTATSLPRKRAGLAMATMDIIKLYGGSPANFLDVGGGASTEKVTEAFKIMLKNPSSSRSSHIFGGIMKCDVIAQGVVTAARQVAESAVGRASGSTTSARQEILSESGLPIISAANMADAAERSSKRPG